MQQLLGDRAAATDRAFVRKLFLQCLPANVRMVLASTTDIKDLSQLADRIMEVTPSPIAAITPTTNDPPLEVQQLRTEVSRLADFARQLTTTSPAPVPDTSPFTITIASALLVSRTIWKRSTKLQTAMRTIGKLSGRSLAATSVAGLSPSRLFYITDKPTGTRFLVDTGTEVSVIPPSQVERRRQADHLTLQAINNTSIATYGKRSLTPHFGLRRTFRWVFVIANVQHPILGADFLRHFSLLVDMRNHQLSDGLQVQGVRCNTKSPSPAILPWKPLSTYDTLLAEFPSITQPCSSEAPTSRTTSKLEVHRSLLLSGVWAPTASVSHDKSSTICWSWGLYNPPPATRHPHFT